MTPAARVQAAIDLLDAIVVAARDAGPAADTLIARYFATRRYAGSKDRRAVRELVYDAIRLCGERPESGRAAMLTLADARPELADLFDGSPHGPAPIAAGEPVASVGDAPGWLGERLAQAGLDAREQAALADRAPLDIRINRLVAADTLPDGEPVPGLPDALRLPAGTDIDPYGGAVEVQDAGSQWVTLAAGAAPDMTVIDLCAGAGGKTLALAAAMENRGRILACDVDRARLSRLAPRAERAGVTIAQTVMLDPGRELAPLEGVAADLVLIDAPCSGTGTWRRNPEARWRLSPARLDRFAATQAYLLDVATALVRPGGAIAYVTCSLLDAEGAEQIAAFLARHPGWTAEPPGIAAGRAHGAGLRLTPHHDATDGFFVARLRAP